MPDENDNSSSPENDDSSSSSNDDANMSIEEEGVEPWNIEVGAWYIAQFKTVQDQRVRYCAGKVLSLSDSGSEVQFDSLRLKRRDPPTFIFPCKSDRDIDTVSISEIVHQLTSERRGHFIFSALPDLYTCV